MVAPLRWILALAVAGALGFLAGRHLGGERQVAAAPDSPLTFPVVAPAGPAASPTAAIAGAAPQQVPRTLHEIMAMPGDFTQSTALYVLAANSDRDGIERLLGEADGIQRGSERRTATAILYERFAELDPDAALEHVLGREGGFDPNWLFAIFHVWARSDLDGALARAAKLDDQKRQAAGTAIVRSRDDLPREARESMVAQLKVAVAVRDPSYADLSSSQMAQRAWQGALATADPDLRQQEMFRVARGWAQQDPLAAIRAIESLQKSSERDQHLAYALQAWAEMDARAAVEWALGRPASYQRAQLLTSALGMLAAKEPHAAIAIFERLSSTEQQQALPQVLMSWVTVDGSAAAEWAISNHGRIDGHAINIVIHALAQQDPELAMRWAASVPGEQGQQLMHQAVQSLSQSDPERASAWIAKMDEGPNRGAAISDVAQGFARSDPRAALAWIARQPSADVWPDAYTGIFAQWAPYDLDGAMSQLNFMLETEHRNAAIRGIIQGAPPDADLIDQLYQRVEGAEAKRQAAMFAYYRLSETDAARAERYRNIAGLAAESGGESMIVQ